MSTHNICFYEEISKIIFQLSSNMHLISSYVENTTERPNFQIMKHQWLCGILRKPKYAINNQHEVQISLCISRAWSVPSMIIEGSENTIFEVSIQLHYPGKMCGNHKDRFVQDACSNRVIHQSSWTQMPEKIQVSQILFLIRAYILCHNLDSSEPMTLL